jgi:hypothetical protein
MSGKAHRPKGSVSMSHTERIGFKAIPSPAEVTVGDEVALKLSGRHGVIVGRKGGVYRINLEGKRVCSLPRYQFFVSKTELFPLALRQEMVERYAGKEIHQTSNGHGESTTSVESPG